MWTSHGPLTRIVVMFLLVTTLFTLVYMDSIFEEFISNHEKTFWGNRGRDAATLGYMLLCAFIHFFMCYVALMYAFSSLQIGHIAGREAKRFYSQNLHLVLAISSFGMVLVSVLKASILVLTRWVIWESSVMLDLSKRVTRSAISLLATLPENFPAATGPIMTGLGTISAYIETGLETSMWAVTAVLNGLYSLSIESNSLGKHTWASLVVLVQQVKMCIDRVSGFVDASIGAYEGQVDIITWREDAFGFARSLLTNSGVFLLVLVTLFSLTAKSTRASATVSTDESSGDLASVSDSEHFKRQSAAQGPPALQLSSSGSPDSGPRSARVERSRTRELTRSLSPNFETIHEADEGSDGTDQPTRIHSEPHEPSPPKKKRGSRLFRDRKQYGAMRNGGLPSTTHTSLSM